MYLEDIKQGLYLAERKWVQTLSLALLFSLVAWVASFLLSDIIVEWGSLQGGSRLRENNAVAFNVTYPQGAVSDHNAEALTLLSDAIDKQTAYSTVLNNFALEDPGMDHTTTILLIGDQIFHMFPEIQPQVSAPCVLRGANLAGERQSLHFRGLEIPSGGFLPQHTVWFDPHRSGLSLDNVQVVVLTTEHIALLNQIEQEELLMRAVFLNPSDAQLNTYISTVAKGNLYLVPSMLASSQPSHLRDLMIRSSLYLLSLAAFCTLALLAYGASLREIIAQEARTFLIRRLYGASRMHLSVHILVFLAVTTLIAPLGTCLLLASLGSPFIWGASIMATLIVCTYTLLALNAIRISARMGGLL